MIEISNSNLLASHTCIYILKSFVTHSIVYTLYTSYTIVYTLYTLYTQNCVYDVHIISSCVRMMYTSECMIITTILYTSRKLVRTGILISIVRYAIRIVCKKFHIVSAYRKCSWIVRYSVRIVWIVSYCKIVCIVQYINKCLKMRFFVKICTFIWI